MKRYILWLSVLIVLVAAGIALARANSFRRHGWRHHSAFAHVARQLNLNHAQKSEIESIWQAERPTIASLVRELNTENKEMDRTTAQGNLDEGKVQEIAGRQGETIAKLLVEKEKLRSRIYTTVLTPDQRAKADRLQERWHSRLDQVVARLERTSDSTGR
jgi:Spy/CpxP family protein refolding chaperone